VTPLEFNFEEGGRLRDQGMAKATNHTERVNEGWTLRAANAVGKFPKSDRVVACEEFAKYAYEVLGLDHPANEHAWGTAMRLAQKLGYVIYANQIIKSKVPTHHRGNKNGWVRI